MTSSFTKQTLGIVSDKTCWRDPEGVKTTGGFGLQVEEFSRYFDRTFLLVCFEEKQEVLPGYLIQIKNLEFVPLPTFDGTGFAGKMDFLLKVPGILSRIWRVYSNCDIWQFRLPDYIGFLGLLVHRLRRNRPAFIWLGTDWPERIRESGDTPVRRIMARLAGIILSGAVSRLPTFALGNLGEKYGASNPYVHPTVSTIISLKDFAASTRSDVASPPRLLFVGRLALEKGLPDLLDALRLAGQQGLHLDLTLVGDGSERGNLEKLVGQYSLQERVHFEGYVPAGEALWSYYDRADIFILPSLSEAQGKVLVEAMAAGLPIIATRVGGIPSLIKGGQNGLLVDPHSPPGILSAIRQITSDPGLRASLIANAHALARTLTIEEQTGQIMQQLKRDFSSLGWRKP